MKLITAYLISLIIMAVGDSFWNNLPVLVTAIVTGIVSIIAALKAHKASVNAIKAVKEVEKVGVAVDGKMEKMLELSREKFHAQGVKEATDDRDKIDAAKNEGELKALKNDQLLKTPPPHAAPIIQTHANEIADKVVEKAIPVVDEIANKVADKVTETIIEKKI